MLSASETMQPTAQERGIRGLLHVGAGRRRLSAISATINGLWGNGSKSVHVGNGASRRGRDKRAAVQLRLRAGLPISPRRWSYRT